MSGTGPGTRHRIGTVAILAVAAATLLAIATPAAAQRISASSITGTVTDESGAVLPGVVVTATSPALQVPQLEAVTDAGGQYRFVELPAGVFKLRYELSGFQPLVREDLTLTVGFAARGTT